MQITFRDPDDSIGSDQFLDLAQRVWPGQYDPNLIRSALDRTINITAWDGDRVVGCVRVLTDGYLFGTITEILVDPLYQRQGIGRRLMELAWDRSPTGLFFGAQSGNEAFFERLGYERGLTSFQRRKPRRR